ncbi:hypothetical protein [Limosilactobacillus mucosae]|uniref:hypothetical protein n=1 Tax=Limosilactobacillus mucosae TaxID=97478 RepID=UPI003CFF15E3
MDFATIHEIRSRFYIKHQTPEAIADTIDYSALLEEFKALGIVFDDRGNLSWHGQKIGVLNKSYAVSLLRKMMVRIIISQFMASERLEVFDPIEQLQVVMTVMKISPEILAMDTDLHTLISQLVHHTFMFSEVDSKTIRLEYAGQILGEFVNPYSSQVTLADTEYEAVVQILNLLITPFMLKNFQPNDDVRLSEDDE